MVQLERYHRLKKIHVLNSVNIVLSVAEICKSQSQKFGQLYFSLHLSGQNNIIIHLTNTTQMVQNIFLMEWILRLRNCCIYLENVVADKNIKWRIYPADENFREIFFSYFTKFCAKFRKPFLKNFAFFWRVLWTKN